MQPVLKWFWKLLKMEKVVVLRCFLQQWVWKNAVWREKVWTLFFIMSVTTLVCDMYCPVCSLLHLQPMTVFFAFTHLKWDSLASLPPTYLAIASLFFCLSSACKKVSFICFLVSIFCKCQLCSLISLRIFSFLMQIVLFSLSKEQKKIGLILSYGHQCLLMPCLVNIVYVLLCCLMLFILYITYVTVLAKIVYNLGLLLCFRSKSCRFFLHIRIL